MYNVKLLVVNLFSRNSKISETSTTEMYVLDITFRLAGIDFEREIEDKENILLKNL